MVKTIAFWVTTGLVAVAMGVGGVVDLLQGEEVAKGLGALGYPLYFAVIIGVWKVAGAIVLLAPKLPLVKEWAYAGIMFDLTGASASHAYSGDPIANIVVPLVLAAMLVGSWFLRPDSRKLPSLRRSGL